MTKNKIKFTFVAVLCLVLLLMPIPVINAHAAGFDEPDRTQNDEPSTVIINPADEMPDSNADEASEVVIVDEDTPLGDEADQNKGESVWLIVGISVGAVAALAVVVAIIVSKARTKNSISFSKQKLTFPQSKTKQKHLDKTKPCRQG